MNTIFLLFAAVACVWLSFFFFKQAEVSYKKLIKGGSTEKSMPTEYQMMVKRYIMEAPRWMRSYLKVLPILIFFWMVVAIISICFGLYIAVHEHITHGLTLAIFTNSAKWVLLSLIMMYVMPGLSKMVFNIPFKQWLAKL